MELTVTRPLDGRIGNILWHIGPLLQKMVIRTGLAGPPKFNLKVAVKWEWSLESLLCVIRQMSHNLAAKWS